MLWMSPFLLSPVKGNPQTLCGCSLAPAFEKRCHPIDGGHIAPATGSGQSSVPTPRRDVEHPLTGPELDCFTE
jgi:hypothetical protein